MNSLHSHDGRMIRSQDLGKIAVAMCLLILMFAIVPNIAQADDAAPAVDFDRQIAPLLASRCLDCHNGTESKSGLNLAQSKTAMAGGDSGEVIVPGSLEDSLLWDYISTDEMPPKKPLTDKEKTLIKAWIEGGAKWGRDPIDPFRYTTTSRAGYDWWCLQPINKPKLADADGSHPIDQFIHNKLAEKNLAPAPPADRRTLIRRLSFDLLGLPPSPEEVDAFVADDSPDAYAKLVERLLNSPHYGERWARHWLDVVRYGESAGFERDALRDNFWPYRDWVVQALNADMPYDEFTRLQLAGDVLRPDDPTALAATGFLVAGAYDEVGQKQQSAAMRAVVRQDELEDMVSVVSQTFLGLTVNCARCHDHKFDPISQAEYYQMTSALAGVHHGKRDFQPEALFNDYAERLQQLDTRLAGIDLGREQLMAPLRQKILQRRREESNTVAPPEPFAEWKFDGNLRDSRGGLHGTAHGTAVVTDGRLVLDGETAYVETVPLATHLSGKTLEAWVSLADLDQRGGGILSVQTLNGNSFDAIVYGERQSRHWMAGSNNFSRTVNFAGKQETADPEKLVHVAIVYREDGTIVGYRNGRPYGKAYQKPGPVQFLPEATQVLLGLRHGAPGGNRMFKGSIECARLYDRALNHAEVAASAGVEYLDVEDAEILAAATPQLRVELEQLNFEAANLRSQSKRYRNNKIYSNVPRKADTVHVLRRGNPAKPAELVSASGIASTGTESADFQLKPDAPDADRRRKLAEWITDPQNPLFARVIVNRVWHYHFGAGLVETPNDFGFNGARPSHPELIDWLAADLIEHGWSLKHLHRQILMSETYRQSSQRNPTAAAIDGNNRLLWRKSPTRLEAEDVRDAVLSIAGQLNPQIGGPGYHDFTTYVHNAQFYDMRDPVGASFNRRSLYRTWVRSGRNHFLDAFDCPDPSTKTPTRAVTTTPLQALAMMNNSFVLRMSDQLAARLTHEFGEAPADQIRGATRLAFGRLPADEEITVGAAFIQEHGLPAYCRVLFNSNEFLYVD
ncbi:Planctomycete cytochrome C [Symmachiella macrocystis]|uniref:Planctomycete cytochrome C n=1 Tax=Symmachiella macrocystis TaxID=2527985 RepID=A0A5C6B5R0_9PLAN|nr:DUF1553 domain-containing protein [Symmachiella macrocystis]TWU06912.1 Planctomycete cytochrome C [Symmachiella macrocystis]